MMQSSPLHPRRAAIWVGRLILAALFIYAGYSKLFLPTVHPRPPIGVALSLFALQVDSYQMLPPWAVNVVAHTLPFAEVALGLLLLTGWQLRIWATVASLVLLGFFAAVIRSYALGLEINCGCFANPEPLSLKTVIRDGLFVLVSLGVTIGAFLNARAPHPWSAPEKPQPV